MSDTESRKAFEDWATHCDYPFEFTTYDDGGYFETDTYVAWIAWKFRDLEVAALKARVEGLEAVLPQLRTAALIDDWHDFDHLIKEALR